MASTLPSELSPSSVFHFLSQFLDRYAHIHIRISFVVILVALLSLLLFFDSFNRHFIHTDIFGIDYYRVMLLGKWHVTLVFHISCVPMWDLWISWRKCLYRFSGMAFLEILMMCLTSVNSAMLSLFTDHCHTIIFLWFLWLRLVSLGPVLSGWTLETQCGCGSWNMRTL